MLPTTPGTGTSTHTLTKIRQEHEPRSRTHCTDGGFNMQDTTDQVPSQGGGCHWRIRRALAASSHISSAQSSPAGRLMRLHHHTTSNRIQTTLTYCRMSRLTCQMPQRRGIRQMLFDTRVTRHEDSERVSHTCTPGVDHKAVSRLSRLRGIT